MNRWMTSAYGWLRRPRSRGQAMAEFSLLLMSMMLLGFGVSSFAPDMLAVFTMYVGGFYIVLGYPLG
ncbi:hypothetical protein LZ198_25000 [Myxococcus sp. K15C18031901]|uniref:hypothetical protein n=1 Tax=Myxococcus dinghuensis TaxID=2906761 RepID=UPI0020A6E9AC|nr:hypothetical protein [Myxococcus dinghuensis]MCP3102131.1 hypothetical protein [Myxococcus dinghuensis]